MTIAHCEPTPPYRLSSGPSSRVRLRAPSAIDPSCIEICALRTQSAQRPGRCCARTQHHSFRLACRAARRCPRDALLGSARMDDEEVAGALAHGPASPVAQTKADAASPREEVC